MANEKVALVIGAGDATGGAIARRFAREGFTACITRRNADKLAPLVASIESEGGKARAFGSDARKEEQMVTLVDTIEREVGPIEVAAFNIGANVRFPIRETTARYGLSPGFFLLVADEAVSAYRLFIELDGNGRPDAREIGAAVDARLGELNIEYHAKRESGRLGPLTVAWLRRGTGEAYKAAGVRAGQREGQFKPRVLQYRKDIALPVEQYVVQ